MEYERKTAEKKAEISKIFREIRKLEGESKKNEVPKVNPKVKFQPKCKFHEKGFCKNAKRCKYRHPSKICEDHEDSHCREGIMCDKRHPQTDCVYWMRGYCSKKEKCLYRHVRAKHGSRTNRHNRNDKQISNPIYINSKRGNIFEHISPFLVNGGGVSRPPQFFPVPPPNYQVIPPPATFWHHRPTSHQAPPRLYSAVAGGRDLSR